MIKSIGMAAPKGNEYWQLRHKHGKDKKFTPDEIWQEAVKYFNWVKENPLWESVLIQKGVVVDKGLETERVEYFVKAPKMRAMTLKALYLHLGIDRKTWTNWAKDKDYVTIITRVENVIFTQKIEGAAAKLLETNIIARELGLIDKKGIEHSGEINTPQITAIKQQKRIEEALKKFNGGN
jgi:hypothetical protein